MQNFHPLKATVLGHPRVPEFSADRVLEAIAEPILVMDVDGNIQYLNEAARRQFALRQLPEPDELAADLLLRTRRIASRSGRQGQWPKAPVHGMTSYRSADGEHQAVSFVAYPIQGPTRELAGLTFRIHRADETSSLLRSLLHDATHDDLTGLVNRREFINRLRRLLRAGHCQGEHMLFFMDLDRFKQINDVCGHRTGDEVLRRLSGLLRSFVRKRDTLGRLGGDEFVLLMEHCPEQKAMQTARAMVDSVRDKSLAWGEQTVRCGLSVGILPIHGGEGDMQSLLDQAEAACYEAKRSRGATPVVLRKGKLGVPERT